VHKLRISNPLVLLIRGLHPEIQEKIRGSLKTVVAQPHNGNPLKDAMEGLRSFKVKRLRIIYRMTTQEEIQILAIGPREQIYEETYRLIKVERNI
jgi:mRNA-degrading endonuclease RelE of RelBE toxin-antitoxin system